ncbi:hypothetical protein ACN28S_65115 [Cystobacter fuscus]
MRVPLLHSLKLRGRLTLYVTLLALIPLGVTSLGGVLSTQWAIKAQVNEMLRIEAEGLKDLVEASLVEREASVRSWAEDALVREALLTGRYEQSDEVLTRLQVHYNTFAGLVLFTDEGRAVSASTSALRDSFQDQDQAVRESVWFRAAQQGQFTSATLTREDPIFGMPVLHRRRPWWTPATEDGWACCSRRMTGDRWARW